MRMMLLKRGGWSRLRRQAAAAAAKGMPPQRSRPSRAKAEPSQAVDLSNLFAGVWMGDEGEEAWSEAGEEGGAEAGKCIDFRALS